MLSADITLHKRALKPLQSLVYGMRRYDLDRCVAIAASVNGTGAPDLSKVRGFLSHQAKVYLAGESSLPLDRSIVANPCRWVQMSMTIWSTS